MCVTINNYIFACFFLNRDGGEEAREGVRCERGGNRRRRGRKTGWYIKEMKKLLK